MTDPSPHLLTPEALLAKVAERDFIDFPTAWAIQESCQLEHNERCSSVPGWHPMSGSALLCDCGAIEAHWEKLRGEAT